MSVWAAVVERIRGLLFRRAEDRALDEEIRFHVEMETDENIRRGLDPREARRRALVRFGGVDRVKEAVRDARGTRGIEDVFMDIRHALRRMRRSPGLTAAIVLTFTLGIGASVTTFGIVDRLLLRPPEHVRDPGSVKRLLNERYLSWAGERRLSGSSSVVTLEGMEELSAFRGVAAWSPHPLVVGSGRTSVEAAGMLVSHDYFSLLGVAPALGRFFAPEEDRRGAAPVVVLGYGFWQRRYGGDPGVLGRQLDLGYGPATVIGVTPKGFTGVELTPVDVWMPFRAAGPAFHSDPRWFTDPGWTWLRLVARLAPDATVASAEAAATTIYRRLNPEEDPDARVVVAPLLAARGPAASTGAGVATWVFAVTVVVLLVVSANIANMLLARGLRRRRETGIRLALGGRRSRLVRESVIEALLMSGLGAAGAVAVSALAGAWVAGTLLPEVGAWAGLSGRVVVFALAAATLSALVAGLFPAIQSGRADVVDTLKGGGRTASSHVGVARRGLAVVQTALSVLLLVGAGLFMRSLYNVGQVDLGIATDQVFIVQPLFEAGVPGPEREAFFQTSAERLANDPAVAGVARTAGSIPFVQAQGVGLYLDGHTPIPEDWQTFALDGGIRAVPPGGGPYMTAVDAGYLGTLGLEVLRGRPLTDADAAGAQAVVLINRTLADWLWPGGGALGQCLQILDTDSACRTVVGVVADAHRNGIVEDPSAQLYIPLAQSPARWSTAALIVRGRQGSPGLRRALRDVILTYPGVRFPGIRSFHEILDPQTRPWRVGAIFFALFGALALVVAAIGVYAVLNFAVAQRIRELGIRAALGAAPEQLAGLVLGDSLRMIAAGLAGGLLLALLVAGRLVPALHHVSAHDPWVLAGVVATLALVGFLAAAIPAWRATSVEPTRALHTE